MGLAVSSPEMSIHVHAVFSRKEWNLIGPAHIPEGPVRSHQLRGLVLAVRVIPGIILHRWPAKVVHAPDMMRVAAYSHHTAHCLIYGTGHHMVGIYPGIGGQQSLGCDQPLERVEDRPDNNSIAVDVPILSHKGLDHACSLHLMVILPYDPFL